MPLIAFLISRAASVFGLQILTCTFIFRLVENNIDALGLSQLGLAATIASLAFAFPLGDLVDRISKRNAILTSHMILLGLTLGLTIVNPQTFWPIIAATACLAVARNFRSISQFTVFGDLIKEKNQKDRWVNLSTLSWQMSSFLAPLLAGILGSGQVSLIIASSCIGLSFFCQLYIVQFLTKTIHTLETSSATITSHAVNHSSPQSLLPFLKNNFKLHASLLLDFFIVLFAGAASLLPFLHDGQNSTIDIGILKSALPAGIIFGTWIRLQKNARDRWAEKLFLATFGYGICHLFLAESPSLHLSYILLFGAGIFDAISLTVRECILQLETPAILKGRVYALNNFLVNASDELSEWESGLAAHWLGVRTAIRFSGLIAIAGAGVFLWKAKSQTALSNCQQTRTAIF
ncbi:MAG: MFS transporter [Bdellovibrionaceae bacterium]|nr:MFS transporter [Pseudobdellovibrionaceae bacterium]